LCQPDVHTFVLHVYTLFLVYLLKVGSGFCPTSGVRVRTNAVLAFRHKQESSGNMDLYLYRVEGAK